MYPTCIQRLMKYRYQAPTFSFFLMLIATYFATSAVSAQTANQEASTRLALFLDCNFCDENFIRQEMPYLDHVRDREVADVHVISNP